MGVLVGIPFAVVFTLADSLLPWRSVASKALALGLLAYVIFSLLPVLNVPTNPPAVETNLSVEARGYWYVATMASAFGGVLGGIALHYLVAPMARSVVARRSLLLGSLIVVALLWAMPFLLKPKIERVPGVVPAGLIETFYYLTLLEWLVFWVALSVALTFLWLRIEATSRPRETGSSA